MPRCSTTSVHFDFDPRKNKSCAWSQSRHEEIIFYTFDSNFLFSSYTLRYSKLSDSQRHSRILSNSFRYWQPHSKPQTTRLSKKLFSLISMRHFIHFGSITPFDSNLTQKLVQGACYETSCSYFYSFHDHAVLFLFQLFLKICWFYTRGFDPSSFHMVLIRLPR